MTKSLKVDSCHIYVLKYELHNNYLYLHCLEQRNQILFFLYVSQEVLKVVFLLNCRLMVGSGVDGPLEMVLGCSLDLRGHSWAAPGTSVGSPGLLIGPRWAVLGCSWAKSGPGSSGKGISGGGLGRRWARWKPSERW